MIAAATDPADGRTSSSRWRTLGMRHRPGPDRPAGEPAGPRWATSAMTAAPTRVVGWFSSTTTSRPVLRTDSTTSSTSSGQSCVRTTYSKRSSSAAMQSPHRQFRDLGHPAVGDDGDVRGAPPPRGAVAQRRVAAIVAPARHGPEVERGRAQRAGAGRAACSRRRPWGCRRGRTAWPSSSAGSWRRDRAITRSPGTPQNRPSRLWLCVGP